jgi:hypothetical protein
MCQKHESEMLRAAVVYPHNSDIKKAMDDEFEVLKSLNSDPQTIW